MPPTPLFSNSPPPPATYQHAAWVEGRVVGWRAPPSWLGKAGPEPVLVETHHEWPFLEVDATPARLKVSTAWTCWLRWGGREEWVELQPSPSAESLELQWESTWVELAPSQGAVKLWIRPKPQPRPLPPALEVGGMLQVSGEGLSFWYVRRRDNGITVQPLGAGTIRAQRSRDPLGGKVVVYDEGGLVGCYELSRIGVPVPVPREKMQWGLREIDAAIQQTSPPKQRLPLGSRWTESALEALKERAVGWVELAPDAPLSWRAAWVALALQDLKPEIARARWPELVEELRQRGGGLNEGLELLRSGLSKRVETAGSDVQKQDLVRWSQHNDFEKVEDLCSHGIPIKKAVQDGPRLRELVARLRDHWQGEGLWALVGQQPLPELEELLDVLCKGRGPTRKFAHEEWEAAERLWKKVQPYSPPPLSLIELLRAISPRIDDLRGLAQVDWRPYLRKLDADSVNSIEVAWDTERKRINEEWSRDCRLLNNSHWHPVRDTVPMSDVGKVLGELAMLALEDRLRKKMSGLPEVPPGDLRKLREAIRKQG